MAWALRNLIVWLVIIVSCDVIWGYPSLVSKCQHPTTRRGAHGAPVPDNQAVFTVTDTSGSKVTSYCPGNTYSVKTEYTSARNVLLTTTIGTIEGGDANCAGQGIALEDLQQTYTKKLTVPCDSSLTGSMELKVTSATSSSGQYQQTSLTLPKGSSCQACTSGSSAPPPPATTTPTTVQLAGANGCGQSSLGYACFKQMCGNIGMHWTLGGAPPSACKYSSAASPTTGATTLHVALQSTASGWIAAAFPKASAKMVPADAMIGWMDGSSGQAVVGAYYLGGKSTSEVVADSRVVLSNKGALKEANGAQVVCFTRDLSQVGQTGILLTSATGQQPVVDMIFAASNTAGLSDHLHNSNHQCGASVNLATGQADIIATDLPRLIAIHGALMIAAWIALLPAGALIARNKVLLQPGPTWFNIHVSVQYLGLAAFVAAIALAWAKFPDGSSGDGADMYKAHSALGIAIIVMAGLQVLAAHLLRPKPDAPKRWQWNLLHWWLGRLALAAAIANVFVGITLNNRKFGEDTKPWLAAAIVILGVLLLAGAGLQVASNRKHTRIEKQQLPHSTQPNMGSVNMVAIDTKA